MEYAIIETGGKQYKVSAGDTVLVDKLSADGTISFDHVLLHVKDADTKIGKPYLSGMVVTGKVLGQVLGDKVHVRRFTAKSRHRRHIGFRAALSKVQITNIGSGKNDSSEKPVKSTKTAKAEK